MCLFESESYVETLRAVISTKSSVTAVQQTTSRLDILFRSKSETGCLTYKICLIPSIVCASFNFLISLFISNVTRLLFSSSTSCPSLHCHFQKPFFPNNMSNLAFSSKSCWPVFFYFLQNFIISHFVPPIYVSSICLQIHISQTPTT